jgi:hypothetical protein
MTPIDEVPTSLTDRILGDAVQDPSRLKLGDARKAASSPEDWLEVLKAIDEIGVTLSVIAQSLPIATVALQGNPSREVVERWGESLAAVIDSNIDLLSHVVADVTVLSGLIKRRDDIEGIRALMAKFDDAGFQDGAGI